MRLIQALNREPLERPPIWFMRQAGRYLPEYRSLRARYGFEEAMRTPKVAAEISLQPIRRFPLDAAIIFSDIMTPLMAMGVPVVFDPGPKLSQMSIEDVARLGGLDPAKVDFVAETVSLVRAELDDSVATIGFAGGPTTLLAYLLEGGGSRHFPNLRRAFHGRDPGESLTVLAAAMRQYLTAQIDAGAQVVQLFDSWAGLLSVEQFERWAVPAARLALKGLAVPTIYFAPGAVHLLESFDAIGATAYGVDWRVPLDDAWGQVGVSHPIQGNLDPAILLSDEETVRKGTSRVLEGAAGRPGHIFNLGHGVLPDSPVENIETMVATVVGWAHQTEIAPNERPITI